MFHKTKEFKELEAHWYSQLKQEGFKDIEDTRDPERLLRVWDSHYFQIKYCPLTFESKQVYFEMAQRFLNQAVFESERDQIVWAHHVEGRSLREIGKLTNMSYSLAYLIIARLRLLMKEMLTHDQ